MVGVPEIWIWKCNLLGEREIGDSLLDCGIEIYRRGRANYVDQQNVCDRLGQLCRDFVNLVFLCTDLIDHWSPAVPSPTLPLIRGCCARRRPTGWCPIGALWGWKVINTFRSARIKGQKWSEYIFGGKTHRVDGQHQRPFVVQHLHRLCVGIVADHEGPVHVGGEGTVRMRRIYRV